MKSLIAVLVAALGLAGCVAVPVYSPEPAYSYSPGYTYYPAPAATFSFGYSNNHHRGPRHRGWR